MEEEEESEEEDELLCLLGVSGGCWPTPMAIAVANANGVAVDDGGTFDEVVMPLVVERRMAWNLAHSARSSAICFRSWAFSCNRYNLNHKIKKSL
jgi:hypothetical protein